MARPLVLSNGGLAVGINKNGMVHDFYYPYVGLENLTNARSKPHYVGLWVDGEFSWLDSSDWHKELLFETDALIGNSTFRNDKLGISLHLIDFVDASRDVFARKIKIINHNDKKVEVRIFFHQVFQISADGRADTALYVPEEHYILDYKGRCTLLAYAQTDDGTAFDQYAVGNAGIENKEGTFRDAEDGELSMSAVEHAGVDSTIRCALDIEPADSRTVYYWIIAGDSQTTVEKTHLNFKDNFESRLNSTRRHWNDWLDIARPHIDHLPEDYKKAVKTSLLLIKAHTDDHGGILAACDSSIYNYGRDFYSYVWPRDGAYAVWPLIKLGYTHEPKNFFEFCRKIIHKEGYLMHKFQPDQAIGSTWHPLVHGNRIELAIQEDETAAVLFMVGEYANYSGDYGYIDNHYDDFIAPMANFLAEFTDSYTDLPHATYDLWEEKFLTTTYSTAITIAALDTAASFAEARSNIDDAEKWANSSNKMRENINKLYSEKRGLYSKGALFNIDPDKTHLDETLDVSSLFALIMFGCGESSKIESTLHMVEENLMDKSPSGGIGRYENDNYFRKKEQYQGNPWFVTSLWMSQIYNIIGDKNRAKELIDWSMDKRLPSGALSEQIDPETSEHIGVTPLVWSHGELINARLMLHDIAH